MLVLLAALGILPPTLPLSRGAACTRGAFVQGAVLATCSFPTIAAADEASETVMCGVLQMDKGTMSRLPNDLASAEVQLRVVGRNTMGPLATVQVPVEGRTFPLEYGISKADLREGVQDFIWLEQDIYVYSALNTASGKKWAEGRGKAKASKDEFGKPIHQISYLTLE